MIIFDIGSMDGREFLGLARSHPNINVYAFEPNPRNFDGIVRRSKDVPNFRPFKLAVSDIDGEREFHIANSMGCSSLHLFNKETMHKYNRNHVTTLTTKTIRLDTFIDRESIPSHAIDYLHIDAQGEDLCILKSLGKYINAVRSGCCETCLVPAYVDEPLQHQVMEFLHDAGFNNITKVAQHDGREENVFFSR